MSLTTRPEQFHIKVSTERANLHSQQRIYVENLYRKGEITEEQKQEMLEVLSREWA